ncbi:T9SS type A sorting domain-containing protein [Fulvivirgaceae bacterium BMA12]|uniref:T9SS type A sorting domain-containing protein n=1 Tax=Agaribacillus aureus TaxID=3051825 RepID=A0ABT8L7W6_9BACT|nr:T9SS type A sorting domain-containing protein [Fulvivirgaceae bacterium BMA12]
MGKIVIYIVIFFLLTCELYAQNQILPPNRRVPWEKAGLQQDLPVPGEVLNILDFGGDNTGKTASDEALRQAIASLNGYGIIQFPAGNYLFEETIRLGDSTILRGEGALETSLQFDLGGQGHLITAEGAVSGRYELSADAAFGATEITLNNIDGLKAGDYIRIYQEDNAVVASDWALNSTGQINQITGLSGTDGLTLADPLRMDYHIEKLPAIEKIQPVAGVGIHCLKIERNDATPDQTSNIVFRYAINCQVQGVESDRCNFSHIALSYSSHIKISASYFHHGFTYGCGGRAYGVVAQFSSGNCLVENNIFEHLRHAMLLQAGANGNVFAYNYSTDPFWEEPLAPTNTAGDLVLHGNYPYANLFEGNIAQNIVIDNSHELNGPINTFFRNRAELFGFIMFPNPASDRQNIIGNEVTSIENPTGVFLTMGNDHLIHGNQVQGEIVPESTTLSDTSYYLSEKPDFLGNYPWPLIGLPRQLNFYSIPAKDRFLKGENLTLCGDEEPVITGLGDGTPPLLKDHLFPNPNRGTFTLNLDKIPISPTFIQVIDPMGQVIFKTLTNEKANHIHLKNQPKGLYIVKIQGRNQAPITLKFVLY